MFYVLGGLVYVKVMGCIIIGFVCVLFLEVEVEGNVDFVIVFVIGLEVVIGSIRMKVGIVIKFVLNMISIGIMIKFGKIYGNLVCGIYLFYFWDYY